MDEYDQSSIKEIFDRFDENLNGVLDREEFYKGFSDLIKSLAEGHNEDEIQQISEEAIERFDLNHNGQIEIDEFNQLMIFLINEKGLSVNDI